MGKKFTLGKGLSALIPDESADSIGENSKILISINKIKSDEEQPRKLFDSEKIAELAESIKTHGIIQPLILREDKKDQYIIVAGERRWRAAKMAGLKEIPAIIMELSNRDILEISLIENIQRQDLNPIEEALAYKKLLNDFKITQEELSKRIGKSRVAITNTIRLTNLDERVQQYIIESIITEGHGRVLLSINDNEKQYEIAQKVIDEKLSVRELERFIKCINDNEQKEKLQESVDKLNPYYREVKNQLQSYFGTKVNILNKKNKGKIEIEYYSEEDLQRILDIINMWCFTWNNYEGNDRILNILISTINDLMPYLIIGMAVIIILLFIMVVILFKVIGRVESRYRKLMKGTTSNNLEEMLLERLNNIEEANEVSQKALEECKRLEIKMKDCIQKVAIMRYKAFENVGSDLSFSIAMLDDKNDGIILTGIYGRQESTTYAKPIDKGISRYDLSEEELYVLNEASNKKIK